MSVDTPLGENEVLLYDTVNSFYAGVARMALCENSITYRSQLVNMSSGEQLAPWYARINPMMQIPAIRLANKSIIYDSREIVKYAYGNKDESAEEKEVIDALYSVDVGSLAFLSAAEVIPLMMLFAKLGGAAAATPKIRAYQKENPDLHDIYEKKIVALANKHFSKKLPDVVLAVAAVMEKLESVRKASGGPWLHGAVFGRVDAIATCWLQWVVRCNDYPVSLYTPIYIPPGLLEYLDEAKSRPAFHKAVGQYGANAFVLTMYSKKNRMVCTVVLLVLVFILYLIYRIVRFFI